ncbi:MAG: hypothetical protein JW832_04555, partial [Deltaproteobacteria bacterium]|nr:hypothetical protein [Deltaproteobacteria bacterium]
MFIFLLMLSAACCSLVWAAMVFFELRPPTVQFLLSGEHIGQQKMLRITAADEQRGLRRFSIAVLQGTKRILLFDEQLGCAGLMEGGASRSKTVSLELKPRQLGLENGPAKLEATVWDYALSHWGRGNAATLSRDIVIDLIVP